MKFGAKEEVVKEGTDETDYLALSPPVIKAPLDAVRKHCLICMDNSSKRVANCDVEDCPIWHLRTGKNPFSKRGKNLTDEQRKEIGERLSKVRGRRKTQ